MREVLATVVEVTGEVLIHTVGTELTKLCERNVPKRLANWIRSGGKDKKK